MTIRACWEFVCFIHSLCCSGVTRVGVTRGSNWPCHPYFFLSTLPYSDATECCSVSQPMMTDDDDDDDDDDYDYYYNDLKISPQTSQQAEHS